MSGLTHFGSIQLQTIARLIHSHLLVGVSVLEHNERYRVLGVINTVYGCDGMMLVIERQFGEAVGDMHPDLIARVNLNLCENTCRLVSGNYVGELLLHGRVRR